MDDIKIKWINDETKVILDNAIEKLINKETEEVYITNIVSNKFVNLYGVKDPDDFNGWQCDWWSHFYFKGIKIYVSGGAFYGTICLNSEED